MLDKCPIVSSYIPANMLNSSSSMIQPIVWTQFTKGNHRQNTLTKTSKKSIYPWKEGTKRKPNITVVGRRNYCQKENIILASSCRHKSGHGIHTYTKSKESENRKER